MKLDACELWAFPLRLSGFNTAGVWLIAGVLCGQ